MDLEIVCVCVCVSERVCMRVSVCVSFECECVRVSWRKREREVFTFVCMRFLRKFPMHFSSLNPAGFHTLTRAAVPSPVHDAVSVQGHEVHLAAASRPHWRKEHLRNSTDTQHMYIVTSLNSASIRDLIVSVCLSYLVIPLTKELQPLSSFVHKDTVQVACLHRTDLNGLFSPAHDLIWADMSCRAKYHISTRQVDYKW